MNVWRRLTVTLGAGFALLVALTSLSFGLGFNGVGSAPCSTATQNVVGSFSSGKAQYLSTGTCTTPGSLGGSIAAIQGL